jgi:DNA-binding beta-propeller fold protein YncE
MKLISFPALAACGLVALAGLTMMTGCGTTNPVKGTPQETAINLPIWPSPPAPARIRYLKSVTGAQDWGIEKSLLRRMIDAILGSGNEHFVRPTGVAEFQRVLYVADPGARALWILDAERNQMKRLQLIDGERLLSPVAVAVRPDGAVFLADSRLKKVFLLDREGNLIRTFAREGLERPAGLAYDPAKQLLYVADSAGQKIVVIAADASVIRSWGHAGNGDGEFNYPTYLALDSKGMLLVTDALNFRVQAFDSAGHFLWKFGHHGDGSGDIETPKGVGFDNDGHIFLVNALFDAVQIFDQEGRFLLGFGEHGTGLGQFWLPGGIFINTKNEIYVADAYNRRIQVLMGIPDSDMKERQ